MDAHDSIRTDASTIHRMVTSDSRTTPSSASGGSASGGSALAGSVSASSLEEAKTVIRGSSRFPTSPSGFEAVDRTPAAVAKVLLGQRLNHFLLEEMIGGGGMGAVFRARDEQLDRIVAIKVIPFVGEDPDLQRRFRNEAQSAARLDHPNIARVFDVGSQDDWHYIVFEYISGTNIRDQVTRDGPHSIDDAIYYTCQLADAIHHASQRGIVHRDIKPSNVLISDDDQVKLVDMGLARSDNFELSEDMTASGVTLGTFDYISPEQARDPRDADVRSDIYSLGCTLYFMLTGRPPYPGGTMLQKLLSHGNSPPPDPRVLRAEVSEDLTAIIHKMLAKSPDLRYQTARDLIADLKELATRENLTRAETLGVVPAPAPSTSLQWVEQHLPWMVAATILLASTLWLQLVSVASRDDLALTPPSTAESPNRPPLKLPAEASSSGPNDISPVKELAPAVNVTSRTEGTRDTTPGSVSAEFPDASDPPKLANVPIPLEFMEDGTATSALSDPTSLENTDVTSPLASSPTNKLATLSATLPLSPSASAQVIRVLGVEDADSSMLSASGIAVTRSLSEAIYWSRQYGIKTIELATPVVRSEPIQIMQDGLVIKSIVGGTVVRFESSEEISMQRTRMMSIGANKIDLQELHLHWIVSSGEVDGGALIAMNDNKMVRLSNCSITVENPTRREDVYAFEVVTDPEMLDRRRGDDVALPSGALPLVAIELENVIVRGEMTMIHMDVAAELQLQWDNGLLAVSRRMIDTAGALNQPAPTAGPIQLSINHLTAYAPRGLVRMRLGVSGAYPVMIDREARNSVFEFDPGLPHFEITGLTSITDESLLVRLRGEANAYDAETTLSDPVLAISDRAGNKRSVKIGDLLSQSFPWEDERSPRWAVRWSRFELPGVPPSQFTPADFHQDGTVLSGFEEQRLPRLPVSILYSDTDPRIPPAATVPAEDTQSLFNPQAENDE